MEAARAAIRAAPEDANLRHVGGRILLESGAIQEARMHLEWAARRLPALADGRFFAGEAARAAGDTAAAGWYRDALRLDPDHGQALFRLAELSFQTGDDRQAEILLRRMVQSEPRRAEGYLALGGLLEAWGRRSEAREVYAAGDSLTGDVRLAEKVKASGP
jgi:tetratricopeptide (TPR) repeat protein